MRAGWVGCALALALVGCDDGDDGADPIDAGPTDAAVMDAEAPDVAPMDAEPMDAMLEPDAAEAPPGDLWRANLLIVEAGGLTIATQLEVWLADDGSAFDRVAVRAVNAQDEVSEIIGEVADAPIDAEGRFELEFGEMVLPGPFNPAGIPVPVTLTILGQRVEDDFWCGDVRGSVPLLMAELAASTFSAAPWPEMSPGACMDQGGVPEGVFIGGEDRPAEVLVPSDYDAERAYPLFVLLHGYGAAGRLQAGYLRFLTRVEQDDIILMMPDGTVDGDGSRHWQGRACCGQRVEVVDDVAYLTGLVADAAGRWNIDPAMVFAIGHSNGGFMANDLGCLASDTFRGVVSLAGSAGLGDFECDGEGVASLTVHGTTDETISYDGAPWHLGAVASAELWATRNGCDEAVDGDALDLVPEEDGAETAVRTWQGCAAPVELWTLDDVGHVPPFDDVFAGSTIQWLLDSVPAPDPMQ